MSEDQKTHKLKILEKYYDPILLGVKTYEIRKNDRGYKMGDRVVLTPIDNHGRKVADKPPIKATIGYVCDYMQVVNYVVFSLLFD